MLSFLATYLFSIELFVALLMVLAPVYWVFDLFVSFMPQYIIFSLVCFIFLVLTRRFKQAAVVIIIASYFVLPSVYLWYPPPASDSHASIGRQSITVLHANLNFRNTKYQPLIDEINVENPTIITLNEMTPDALAAIHQGTNGRYAYSVERPARNFRGMAVLSQIPIAASLVIDYSDITPPLLKVQFENPAMTLYAVHALSPISESWAIERNAFIQFLGDTVLQTPGNVILSGDFNATVYSPSFKLLLSRAGLHDTRLGQGWQPSWQVGTAAQISIDHVVYRGLFDVERFSTLGDIASDHRPVLVQLGIQQ